MKPSEVLYVRESLGFNVRDWVVTEVQLPQLRESTPLSFSHFSDFIVIQRNDETFVQLGKHSSFNIYDAVFRQVHSVWVRWNVIGYPHQVGLDLSVPSHQWGRWTDPENKSCNKEQPVRRRMKCLVNKEKGTDSLFLFQVQETNFIFVKISLMQANFLAPFRTPLCEGDQQWKNRNDLNSLESSAHLQKKGWIYLQLFSRVLRVGHSPRITSEARGPPISILHPPIRKLSVLIEWRSNYQQTQQTQHRAKIRHVHHSLFQTLFPAADKRGWTNLVWGKPHRMCSAPCRQCPFPTTCQNAEKPWKNDENFVQTNVI